jgi:hypothetical protein
MTLPTVIGSLISGASVALNGGLSYARPSSSAPANRPKSGKRCPRIQLSPAADTTHQLAQILEDGGSNPYRDSKNATTA